MGALKRTLPHAAITNAYGTTEGGRWCSSASQGLPQPELSVGYPHPQVKRGWSMATRAMQITARWR